MQSWRSRKQVRAQGALFVVATVASSLAAPTAPGPRTPWQAGSAPTVVLAEVLFDPGDGDTAFVEVLNAGSTPAYLDSMVLKIDTTVLPLPRLDTTIDPGARVLIRFDGRATVEGRVVHASPDVALNAAGGTLTLARNDDRVLDVIAWGNAPGAFVPTIGGLAMRQVERGSSLGRQPGANRPGAMAEWVLYAPDLVTPGQANPLPPVAQLIPVDGAILEGTSVDLSWYPVSGAARYRVQVARDTTFAQTVLDQNVTVPEVNTGQLSAGVYWWRVQAFPTEGPAAPWSRPNMIELGSAIGRGDDADQGTTEPSLGGDDAPAKAMKSAPVLLPVPLILQHKDSKMLHLESLQEARSRTAALQPPVPHAWDRDHGTLHKQDELDNMNCALASLAMMNRYYGKDLTQDRIGYEGWSRNIAKYKSTIFDPAVAALVKRLITLDPAEFIEGQVGPERDLHWGSGSPWGRLLADGIFALGSLPGENSGWSDTLTMDDMWRAITYEIDARRPIYAGVPGHAIVIRGYGVSGARRIIYINDPWFGRYAMDLDAKSSGPMNTSLQMIWTYPAPKARSQEPEVAKDSDGDGVVDFDETERFHTNPNNKDSDADGVPDKEDIESGTYEAIHGYGYAYTPGPDIRGRDYDHDGISSELDPDSDNGGCKDGEEDLNGNGEWAANETDNFDETDDFCGSLQGNLSYRSEYRGSNSPQSIVKYGLAEGVILVRVKPEPGSPGHFVDDSSTFHYRGIGRLEIDYGQCILRAREVSSGGGAFIPPDGNIGIGVADDGTVAVEAYMSVPSRARAGGCGLPGGSGSQQAGLAFPDCVGKEVPAAKRAGTPVIYRFNCSNSGTTPDGSTYSTDVRGYLRLVPPPPD